MAPIWFTENTSMKAYLQLLNFVRDGIKPRDPSTHINITFFNKKLHQNTSLHFTC